MIAKDRIADAPNPATDAAIVAAIRAGRSMRVAAVDRRGSPFADLYALDGAASAPGAPADQGYFDQLRDRIAAAR